jgi:hypothetical protein
MDTTVVTAAAADTDEANEIHQQLSSTTESADRPNLPDELNLQLNSSNKEHQNQEENSNKQTPKQEPTYNDYVNKLYNKVEAGDEEEEVKPLLKSIVKSPSGNVRPSLPLNGTRSKNKRLSWQASDPSKHHVQFNNHNQSQHNNNHEQHDVNTQSTSLDSSEEPVTQNEECPSSPITSSSSDSSSSDDEDEFSECKAPDGGWGWVVVFASFMINMIADGITFSFGIFNVEFLKYFGDSKGKTAWIGSIFMASPLLSGPIASYLTDRYGCRKVTIVGSITASIGFLLSAMSDSMEMLFVTFGVIAGVGLSLCYVAAVVSVAYYFDKRRSFATGISVCGSGIGTFIFPPIIQYLISEYGWRGCTVLLAGIFLNMCICGALMRDLEWTTHHAKQKRKNRLKTKNGTSFDSFSITTSTNTGALAIPIDGIVNENGAAAFDQSLVEAMAEDDPHLFSSLINLPTFAKNGEKVRKTFKKLILKALTSFFVNF